jgi:hypothetical protein
MEPSITISVDIAPAGRGDGKQVDKLVLVRHGLTTGRGTRETRLQSLVCILYLVTPSP